MVNLSHSSASVVLLATTLLLLISCHSVEVLAFSSPPTRACRRQQFSQMLLASNSDVNDDSTDNLLEKARRLRQEVSAIESSKLETQKENAARQKQKQMEENKVQEQLNKQRLRYSAEVPILKDMGEEVMERVDFPPRLKGGKYNILECISFCLDKYSVLEYMNQYISHVVMTDII